MIDTKMIANTKKNAPFDVIPRCNGITRLHVLKIMRSILASYNDASMFHIASVDARSDSYFLFRQFCT